LRALVKQYLNSEEERESAYAIQETPKIIIPKLLQNLDTQSKFIGT